MLSQFETLDSMQALMVALSGLATVFLVLGCLAVLIVVNAKVADYFMGKAKPAAAPAAKAAPVAAAPAAPAQDQEELVAVLMAAIAEETQSNPGDFRITSISQQ